MKSMTWPLAVWCTLVSFVAVPADIVDGPFRPNAQLVEPEKAGICLRYSACERRSTHAVSGPDAKEFVDVGIVGYGVEAYLSLTSAVIVVDGETKKTRWAKDVSFWYVSLSFVEAIDSSTWNNVVLLRIGGQRGDGRFFDIETGTEKFLAKDVRGLVALDEEPKELRGKPLEIGIQFSGDDSKIEVRQCVRITSQDEWQRLWSSHTGESDDVPTVDFSKQMAVGVFDGRGMNCEGIDLGLALDCDDAIELFVRGHHYQTGLEGNRVTAFGIYVIPKSAKKLLVKEDCQHLIDGPPIWKIVGAFAPLDDDAQPENRDISEQTSAQR